MSIQKTVTDQFSNISDMLSKQFSGLLNPFSGLKKHVPETKILIISAIGISILFLVGFYFVHKYKTDKDLLNPSSGANASSKKPENVLPPPPEPRIVTRVIKKTEIPICLASFGSVTDQAQPIQNFIYPELAGVELEKSGERCRLVFNQAVANEAKTIEWTYLTEEGVKETKTLYKKGDRVSVPCVFKKECASEIMFTVTKEDGSTSYFRFAA